VNSAFLVFDLVAGNTCLEVKGDTRNVIDQERDHRKKTVGLVSREESQSGAGATIVWVSSAKRFIGVSEYLQIFKTFWLKSETGGFENIKANTRMRPLENLSARPAVAGLQFAQMVRTWDQSQPA
jgi:hypothetical protein